MLFCHLYCANTQVERLELVKFHIWLGCWGCHIAFGRACGRAGRGFFLRLVSFFILRLFLGLGLLGFRSFFLYFNTRKQVGTFSHHKAGFKAVKMANFVFNIGDWGHALLHLLGKLRQHFARGNRHHGPEAQRGFAHGRQHYIHNCGKAFHVALLVERPGGLGVYIFIEGAHEFPQRFQPLRKLHIAKKLHKVAHGIGAQVGNGLVVFLQLGRHGHTAAKIFGGHGKHAAEQVAKVVGKIGVDAPHKGIVAKAGV